MPVLGVQFGLTSDEFAFIGVIVAAIVAALAPVYVGMFKQRRDTKTVKHQVTERNGVNGSEPTIKDYVKAAWDEAIAARAVADNARHTAIDTTRRLDDHLIQAEIHWREIQHRIGDVDRHLGDLENKVVTVVTRGNPQV